MEFKTTGFEITVAERQWSTPQVTITFYPRKLHNYLVIRIRRAEKTTRLFQCNSKCTGRPLTPRIPVSRPWHCSAELLFEVVIFPFTSTKSVKSDIHRYIMNTVGVVNYISFHYWLSCCRAILTLNYFSCFPSPHLWNLVSTKYYTKKISVPLKETRLNEGFSRSDSSNSL